MALSDLLADVVAPFTGARIETGVAYGVGNPRAVAPFTGARIETARTQQC